MTAASPDAELVERAAAAVESMPGSVAAPGEAAVALTDALLALESGVFAIMLARDPDGQDHPLRSPFLVFFGATAMASLCGAALHGLTTERSDPRRRALWRTSLASIGLASLSAWLLAGRLALPVAHRSATERAATLAHVPYLLAVTTGDRPYRVAVLWYIPGAIALGGALASRLPYRGERGPAAIALAGLGITFLAAGVQIRRVGFGPRFDHNALYHTLQAIGVALFHRAARGFVGLAAGPGRASEPAARAGGAARRAGRSR